MIAAIVKEAMVSLPQTPERSARGAAIGLVVFIIAFTCLVGLISSERQYFGYTTETDYLGGFVPEAKRVLNSEPLAIEFHPPFYAVTIAFTNLLTDDWFVTGRIVSLLSAVTVLLSCYLFFYRLGGYWVAFGSLAGLAASSVFVQYSATAASDLFFLALFCLTLVLTLAAVERQETFWWFASGFTIGLCLITRTNGLASLLFFAVPWFREESSARIRNSVWMLTGLLIPTSFFVGYSLVMGSQILPSSNYANLAMTYFSDSNGRISGDAREGVLENFDSVGDVIFHDPPRMIRIYVIDLVRMIVRQVPALLEVPLSFLFLPGTILLISRRFSKTLLLFLMVYLGYMLLNNFKAYEARYYLFLVPLLGAGAGEMCARLWSSIQQPGFRAIVALGLAVGLVAAIGKASLTARQELAAAEPELREAVPAARKFLQKESTLVARKGVVAYYTGAESEWFPNVQSLGELRGFLGDHPKKSELYLFYGQFERHHRPQFSLLADPQNAPEWLQPLANGRQAGSWVLYRYADSNGNID